MMTVPFLTDIDPQAAVKASRDPLGLQTIWARLGRHVVGSLTTVSTSVRDFATLVLGYYFAERVANEATGDGDLAVFLRWEQVAAYARGGINGDWEFRWVDRVRAKLLRCCARRNEVEDGRHREASWLCRTPQTGQREREDGTANRSS